MEGSRPCDFEDSGVLNSSSFRIGKYIIPVSRWFAGFLGKPSTSSYYLHTTGPPPRVVRPELLRGCCGIACTTFTLIMGTGHKFVPLVTAGRSTFFGIRGVFGTQNLMRETDCNGKTRRLQGKKKCFFRGFFMFAIMKTKT